jgi:hypothetical protein
MKALTVKQLSKALSNLANNQVEVTLNLAYHATIHGNVEVLAGFTDAISSVLHKEYKAFVSSTYDKKSKVWVYNKTKAMRLCANLSLVFGVSTFEEFLDAVTTQQPVSVVEKTDIEKRAMMVKRVETALAAALAMGIDEATLSLMVKAAKAKV